MQTRAARSISLWHSSWNGGEVAKQILDLQIAWWCSYHDCTNKEYILFCVYNPKFSLIIIVHVLMRKEERSKQGQTNNKAKQHSIPKAVTFPKKNELYPAFEYLHVHTLPSASDGTRTYTTLHSRKSTIPLSSAGWAQISNLTVHLRTGLLSTKYEGEGRGNKTTKHQTGIYMFQ